MQDKPRHKIGDMVLAKNFHKYILGTVSSIEKMHDYPAYNYGIDWFEDWKTNACLYTSGEIQTLKNQLKAYLDRKRDAGTQNR